MVLKQLVVFADSDVSLRLETVADQAAISSNTVSPAPLRIRRSTDWVGDKPELLTDPETGEIRKVHIFATTLGISSLIYAEAFMDEKLAHFIEGTVHAVQFYGGITKFFVPDNLKTAVIKCELLL